MNRERRKRFARRLHLADGWEARSADRAENALFDGCFELAEAARDLERVAGATGSGGASAASLGCVTSAFESLANAMLTMRGVVLAELPRSGDGNAQTAEPLHTLEADPTDVERLGRLLFAIDQNLRFAAHAADLARQTASKALTNAP